MASSASSMEKFILSPSNRRMLSLIKGLRNGAVYGAKVRFAHALVVTFLFKGGSWRGQAETILDATYTHSRNLAMFVVAYKGLTLLLEQMDSKSKTYHSFLAAFVGGYLVFGKYNKVNEQINLYLLSRVLYALVKLAAEKQLIPRPNARVPTFALFAALVWALVLWLFEHHGNTLQPSLLSSMSYLYHDSNVWTGFRNFLVHNI